MNKWLYFATGLILGAAGGVAGCLFYSKKKYQKMLEEDFDEYDDISGYYRTSDDEVNPDRSNTGRETGLLSPEERDEIKAKLSKNWEGTTNYAAMYNEHPVDSDEDDISEEDVEDEDEISEDAEAALEATEEHEMNKNKKPKIISYDAVTELPGYIEQDDLFYYMGDGVLVNEAEEELDPETFIGDALYKYGFADDQSNESEIYVMNYALDTCYCVTKVYANFSEVKNE